MPRMNRRSFIGTSVAAATLMAARPSWAVDTSHKLDKIGVQLYSVRATMKDDFEGTITKVAGAGYKEVEFAGYFDHSPKDVRALLDKLNITSPSAHVPYASIETKWQETLDAANVVGHKFLVCPATDDSMRKTSDGWKKAGELFNKAGEASKKAGIQFCYHNHYWEFDPLADAGGKLPYDVLLAETDAKNVKMEMDLCWITVAGHDPLTYFSKYPGRFPLVHVKDWVKGDDGKMGPKDGHMTNVGSGAIDFKRIFKESKKAGIEHYFVENDEAKSVDDIKASFDYLHNLSY
jgi:sugar phosphate isomerase/epimerase